MSTLPKLKDPSWRTPDVLWEQLHSEYRFNLDVAASVDNTKLASFFDVDMDALSRPWDRMGVPARVWCNPPYNPKGEIERWLQKGLREATRGVFSVFLVPMASSVGWFNDLVVPYAEWHTFRGRVAFVDPVPGHERSSPKQDNLLVIFDPQSHVIGHTSVRSSKTGKVLWTNAGARDTGNTHEDDVHASRASAPAAPAV